MPGGCRRGQALHRMAHRGHAPRVPALRLDLHVVPVSEARDRSLRHARGSPDGRYRHRVKGEGEEKEREDEKRRGARRGVQRALEGRHRHDIGSRRDDRKDRKNDPPMGGKQLNLRYQKQRGDAE